MRACLEREIFMKRREEQKTRIEKKRRRKREADLARGTVAPSGETFRPRRPGELGPWAREEKFGNEIMTSRADIPLKLRATSLE